MDDLEELKGRIRLLTIIVALDRLERKLAIETMREATAKDDRERTQFQLRIVELTSALKGLRQSGNKLQERLGDETNYGVRL